MLKENPEVLLCLLLMLHPISTDKRKNDLNFLLVGNTGSGKSATGNSIMGQWSFATSAGVKSLTKDIKLSESMHHERKLTVVDTPGFAHTNLKPTEYLPVYFDVMGQAMSRSRQGYHAFLFVVRYGGRFTDEEKQTFNALRNCFGEEYFSRYGVLIVTFGDMYDPEEHGNKSFSEWINTEGDVLKEMMNEFGGRFVLFDNKSKDPSKRKNQVDSLIKIVDQLSVIDSRYSTDHFELARYQRNKYAVEAKLPGIELEVRKEMGIVVEKLEKFKLDKPEKQLDQLYELRTLLDKLLRQIQDEDNDTGVLNVLITAVKKVIDNIKKEIDYVRNPPQENELQNYSSGGLISDVIGAVKNFLSFFFNYVRQIVHGKNVPRITESRDDKYHRNKKRDL